MGDYRGNSTLIIGPGEAGKTAFCQDLVEIGPHIWVGPEPTNPGLEIYQYWYDSDSDLEHVKPLLDGKHTLAIWVRNDNPRLFDYLERRNITLVLDDITCFTQQPAPPELKNRFIRWARLIKTRDQHVYMTTHRAIDDLPPLFYRNLFKNIYYVGPQTHPKEIEQVFWLKSAKMNITKEELTQKLGTLEVYDWQRKNQQSAVLQIRGADESEIEAGQEHI
jgi:hypothetical protein